MNAPFTPNIDNSTLKQRWLSHSGRLFTVSWSIIGTAAIGLGWHYRDEGYLSADSGLGYWLGILGGSAMLLLLTYSLRKRWRLLRRALPVKWWFQLHMTLGIAGPLAILFHSNFHLGSLNSTVALVCMLLVAGSGIIGRYIYNRIHSGLYGERIRLREALTDFQSLQLELTSLAVNAEQKTQCDQLFSRFESLTTQLQQSNGLSFWKDRSEVKSFSRALEKLIKSLNTELHTTHNTNSRVNDRIQQDYAILMAILRKLPGLQLYERLFSLWHVIHIPIFILMVITAIVHVVVVHMY